MRALALAACSLLGACSVLSPSTGPGPNDAPGRTLQVNGEAVVITQITASTWTAMAPGRSGLLPASAENTAALRRAVESVSGCTVTDSDFSGKGRQFDAQVDCAQRPRK